MSVKYVTGSLLLFAALLISFFCTDPIQPDYTYKPEISQNGTIQTFGTLDCDSTFGLYVVVTGTKPFTYYWYRSETLDTTVNNDTLLFPAVSMADSGRYFCIVTNSTGSDTTTVYTLVPVDTIPKPPVITNDGQVNAFGVLVTDSSFGISVLASGTEQITYKWYKNGTVIPNVSDDTLYFQALILADTGSYLCIASNDWELDSSNVFNLHFGNFAPH